jgi:hypothetical protein
MNVKDVRRENMRSLARQCGGISDMAKRLERSQSQISHLIGKTPIKNIGDRIATTVEKAFNKPPGWLDREHFRRQEATAVHDVGDTSKGDTILYRVVPILSWDDIRHWPAFPQDEAHSGTLKSIPGVADLSPRSFAVPIIDESMESAHGVSFPVKSMIIVDPDHDVEHGMFVIVRTEKNKQVVFRQLMHDGKKRFLKPLNERYPVVEVEGAITVFGVVRQMTMLF